MSSCRDFTSNLLTSSFLKLYGQSDGCDIILYHHLNQKIDSFGSQGLSTFYMVNMLVLIILSKDIQGIILSTECGEPFWIKYQP